MSSQTKGRMIDAGCRLLVTGLSNQLLIIIFKIGIDFWFLAAFNFFTYE
jgi:hypothetical protein